MSGPAQTVQHSDSFYSAAVACKCDTMLKPWTLANTKSTHSSQQQKWPRPAMLLCCCQG